MAISDSLNSISPLQKLVILILLLTMIIGGFIYFVYLPDNVEISRLTNDIENLKREIDINKVRAKRLAELKQELENVQRELALKKDQLPPEIQAVQLLEQVEKLGNKIGLEIKLWRPGARRVNSSGLYVELPVDVEFLGSYHEFGMFFDQISKFSQVINVSNLKMGNPKQEKGKWLEPVTFLATAFASVEKKESSPSQEKRK
ncbi:MAG: type 4a pilus biogenesis protein PilO [Nitrospirae bacterium]|nr:type 4a pilus biogenesis protein PilO [Nitrospirota bacterium]